MSVKELQPIADFKLRSIITHALMAFAGAGALGSAFLLPAGDLRTVSVVAFINFAAGLWIAQAVHSLGNSFTDSDYQGVLRSILSYVG